MDLVKAFEIVIELARQNIPDVDDGNQDMAQDITRCEEACKIVEDFAVNQLGDD